MSGELLARLTAYPKMRAALEALPPKLLSLASDRPPMVVELQASQLGSRVEETVQRIQRATFTGAGDKEAVPSFYRDYAERIAGALQRTARSLLGERVLERD